MTHEHALYAIEDILGGHCAVVNFAIRALIDVATRPQVQAELQSELTSVLAANDFSLADKSSLTYLQATFFETARTTCSAIVPHVANRNTTIAGEAANISLECSHFHCPGYKVEANTVVWINNHHMHFNEEDWDQPGEYNPRRFLGENGFRKPSNFQPFSLGKRQCMGYKIVEYVTSFFLASILHKFDIKCDEAMRNQPVGQLGLAPKPFYFTLKKHELDRRTA